MTSDIASRVSEQCCSWLYCDTCRWMRTVRAADADSSFALAEGDARMHAGGESGRRDHRVYAVHGGTGEIAVHE